VAGSEDRGRQDPFDEGWDEGWDDTVTGEVDRLPGVGGWHVVRLAADRTERWRHAARRGFVPVTVELGGTTWDSSLMPMGDGTLFVAVPAQVRRGEDVVDGDEVTLRYRLRPPRPAGRPGAAPGRPEQAARAASTARPAERARRRVPAGPRQVW
jgi:hypothetical protein